jgi:AraC family transcriptional regulator
MRSNGLAFQTECSLIATALEVGYTSPSHFGQVFRRTVGVTPTEFGSAL